MTIWSDFYHEADMAGGTDHARRLYQGDNRSCQ